MRTKTKGRKVNRDVDTSEQKPSVEMESKVDDMEMQEDPDIDDTPLLSLFYKIKKDYDTLAQYIADTVSKKKSASSLGEGIASTKRMRVMHYHMLDSLSPGEKLPLRWNERCQPVGPNRRHLTSYIGYLVNKKVLIPVNNISWKSVSQHHKDEMWKLVDDKFELKECNKRWVLMRAAKLWRLYKCKLVKEYYDTWDNDEDRLANPPPNLPFDQWRDMVTYWGTDKWKKLRKMMKGNRAHLTMFHISGRKPMEQIEDEMRMEIGDLNATIPRVYTWKKAYQRPDGSTATPAVTEAISKINEIIDEDPNSVVTARDDCLARAIKPDNKAAARGVGSGITAKDLFGDSSPKCYHRSHLDSDLVNLKQENENLRTGHDILMERNKELRRNQERQQEQINMLMGMLMKNDKIDPINSLDRSQFPNQKTPITGELNSMKASFNTPVMSQSMKNTRTPTSKLGLTKAASNTRVTRQSMKHIPTPTIKETLAKQESSPIEVMTSGKDFKIRELVTLGKQNSKAPFSTPGTNQSLKHIATPTSKLTSTKVPSTFPCRSQNFMHASNLTSEVASITPESLSKGTIINGMKFDTREFIPLGRKNAKVPYTSPFRSPNLMRAPNLASEVVSRKQEQLSKAGLVDGKILETREFNPLEEQIAKVNKISREPEQPSETECEQECALKDKNNKTVAVGLVLSDDPNTIVHHKLLGTSSYKVKLISIIKEDAPLLSECSVISTLADVSAGGILAWPKAFTKLI